MNHVHAGFLKAAGILQEVIEEAPKIITRMEQPAEPPAPQPPLKKKRIVKTASGDMVKSPENEAAWNRRVDQGLQSEEKWRKAKKQRRAVIGLGTDTTPHSGVRDEPRAENGTPVKADAGDTPGTGGMP